MSKEITKNVAEEKIATEVIKVKEERKQELKEAIISLILNEVDKRLKGEKPLDAEECAASEFPEEHYNLTCGLKILDICEDGEDENNRKIIFVSDKHAYALSKDGGIYLLKGMTGILVEIITDDRFDDEFNELYEYIAS